jgi:hypothetical protein
MADFREGGFASSGWLRTLVFVMAALSTAAILWISFIFAKEMLWPGSSIGRSVAWKAFIVCAVPYMLCVVPAAVLAILNRRLPLALMACILAMPLGAAIGFSIA